VSIPELLVDPLGKSPIPLPFLILAKVAMAGSLLFFFLKDRWAESLLFESPIAERVGQILAACGLMFVILGFIALGESVSVGLPRVQTEFRTRGIFHVTRNPLYLGGFLACLGSCLYAPHIVNLVLFLLTLVIHHQIVLKEEMYLEGRFGDQWGRYRRKVPRYLLWGGRQNKRSD